MWKKNPRDYRKESRRLGDFDKNCGTPELSGRVGRSAYVNELVKFNPQNQHFTFLMKKKSIKNQVRKKYGVCSTYFSSKHKEISSGCCRFLYVGRWAADNTGVHFHEFMKKASLNRNFMLRLRMVNPIINCFKITSVMSSLSHKLVHVPCILSTVYLRKPSSHPRKAELIWMEWLSIFIFLLPRVNSTMTAMR